MLGLTLLHLTLAGKPGTFLPGWNLPIHYWHY
jgi:hypothetical protein